MFGIVERYINGIMHFLLPVIGLAYGIQPQPGNK